MRPTEQVVQQVGRINVNTQTPCAACGRTAPAIRVRGIPQLARCAVCGLRWLIDPPSGPELAQLYSSGYYEPVPPRAAALVRALHRANNAIRLRELRGEPGRVLDVGCGKGRFLAAARAAGWDGIGVEFAPASAAAARELAGVDVLLGDFTEVSVPGEFDAITFWHVLEHLPDPAAAVARAAQLVRPGGQVVISVPNVDSFQARLGGASWFHLDLPRHLFHFGPRSLTCLVERAGLRVVRIGHFYPEMEAIGLIQTLLNRASLGQGLLYRFGKRDPRARLGHKVLASMAVALATAPAALVWAVVAPLLGTGASIQLIAERPRPGPMGPD